MELISGEIEPGIRISNYLIGSKKEDVISNLGDNYKIWEREDGFCIYTMVLCQDLVQNKMRGFAS